MVCCVWLQLFWPGVAEALGLSCWALRACLGVWVLVVRGPSNLSRAKWQHHSVCGVCRVFVLCPILLETLGLVGRVLWYRVPLPSVV